MRRACFLIFTILSILLPGCRSLLPREKSKVMEKEAPTLASGDAITLFKAGASIGRAIVELTGITIPGCYSLDLSPSVAGQKFDSAAPTAVFYDDKELERNISVSALYLPYRNGNGDYCWQNALFIAAQRTMCASINLSAAARTCRSSNPRDRKRMQRGSMISMSRRLSRLQAKARSSGTIPGPGPIHGTSRFYSCPGYVEANTPFG
jgi:hypothetical protein